MLVSTILHWLVSQCLFFLRLSSFSRNHQRQKLEYHSGMGFSAIAIIFGIMVGSVTVICVLVTAILMKLDPSMPVLRAGCSLVISAGCHAPADDKDPHLQKVQWGAVVADCDRDLSSDSLSLLNDGGGADMDDLDGAPRRRHCCFTTFEVSQPIPGKTYS